MRSCAPSLKLFSAVPEKEWSINSIVSAFTAILTLRYLDAANSLALFETFRSEGFTVQQMTAHLDKIPKGDYLMRFYAALTQDNPDLLPELLNNFIACATCNRDLSESHISIVKEVLALALTPVFHGNFTIMTDGKGELTLNNAPLLAQLTERCKVMRIDPLDIFDFPSNLHFNCKNGRLIHEISSQQCVRH